MSKKLSPEDFPGRYKHCQRTGDLKGLRDVFHDWHKYVRETYEKEIGTKGVDGLFRCWLWSEGLRKKIHYGAEGLLEDWRTGNESTYNLEDVMCLVAAGLMVCDLEGRFCPGPRFPVPIDLTPKFLEEHGYIILGQGDTFIGNTRFRAEPRGLCIGRQNRTFCRSHYGGPYDYYRGSACGEEICPICLRIYQDSLK